MSGNNKTDEISGAQGATSDKVSGSGLAQSDAANDAPRAKGSFAIWLILSASIIVFDQITKMFIIKWVALYEKIPVNSFINITHQRNTGAAFSFLAGAGGWQRWFFIALGTLVSVYIVVWLWRIRGTGQAVLSAGLALVMGGAIGNVVDRIRLGSVVDFIQVMIGSWPFPSFNVADSAITVGAVFLIIDALFLAGRNTSSAAVKPDP